MNEPTKDMLRAMCTCMAARLTDCAMFLEGKAHLFRAHNAFDDAQEYSNLAQQARKDDELLAVAVRRFPIT